MSSKRHLRRKGCGDKVRHATREAARAHLFGLVRKFDKPSSERLETYQCRFCRGWHVGHPPR